MNKFLLLLLCTFSSASISAQTINVLSTGHMGPSGICRDQTGNLYVAETGTGNADGKITMVDNLGNKQTVVYGFPSYLDTSTHEITGLWRPFVSGTTLWAIIGGGPDPLNGTIMQFSLDSISGPGDSLTIADTIHTIHIQSWVLSNGFPESNVFSAVHEGSDLYVVDAAANAVLKVDQSGMISVLDTFPDIPNTWTPFPPTIDYVPTKIISDMMGGFYMCNLTGFPFLQGIAQVVHIDTSGNVTVEHSGLSQAVDMEMDANHNLYVLQFGTFDSTGVPVMNSGSIIRIMHDGTMDTLATGFGPSAGMTLGDNDDVYVTELMTGNVLHISGLTTTLDEKTSQNIIMSFYPNPVENELSVNFYLEKSSLVSYSLIDITGRSIHSSPANRMISGTQNVMLNTSDLDSGIYYFILEADGVKQTLPIVRK